MINNVKNRLLVSICTIIILSFSSSSQISAAQGLHTSKTELDNGMKVIVSEMPSSSMVSVYALIETGSATEGKWLGTGISHFMEHMAFKGTQKRAVGAIAREVQSLGGTINAWTGKDRIMFTLDVPAEHFDKALDILSDSLMNSTLSEEEVERERVVIVNEMRLHRDNPDRAMSRMQFENVYLQHPYKHEVIGYDSLFAKITRDDLYEFYKEKFIPNNMIFSVAGNIQIDEVLPKIETAFSAFERGPSQTYSVAEEPEQITPRYARDYYPTDITRVTLNFPSTSILNPDLFAMDVLSMILGQGQTSRLYLKLYKKEKIVYSIFAGNYTPQHKGLFEVGFNLDEPNIQKAIDSVWSEINLIKEKGVSKEELERAKRQVMSDEILDKQSSGSVASSQAMNESFTGDERFSDHYVDGIRNLNQEDIQRVARKYLKKDHLTTAVLLPEEYRQQDETQQSASQQGSIEKIVLDNELTVLLREDHTFPSISIGVVLNGGTRIETQQMNGLFQLLSSVWTKGTTSMSAKDIAEFTENLGIRLGAFSGRNSFGITMQMLTENFDDSINLLSDLIYHPTFPKEEIDQIKQNTLVQIKEQAFNPFYRSSTVLKQELFHDHSLSLDQMGTEESIKNINQDTIKKIYSDLVKSTNMVISVYGDINRDDVLKAIKSKFSKLEPQDFDIALNPVTDMTEAVSQHLTLPKEQSIVMIGFQAPSMFDPDREKVNVAASVLGSSFSGRLFANIRDKMGHAYTIGGAYVPAYEGGFIFFYALTSEDKVELVKDLIFKEIKTLQTEPVSDKELETIKSFLKGTKKAGIDTNSNLMFLTSLDELYGMGFDQYKSFDDTINQISTQDVQEMAKKYMEPNKAAVVIITPQAEK